MTSTESGPAPRNTRRTLLIVLVTVIIVSFAVAAVAGITVLIAGPAGDLMDRVLVTTLIVGGFSVGALSCISLWGKTWHGFGVAGAGVAAASAAVALMSVWVHDGSEDFWWTLNRLLASGIIASAGWALASLLLLLWERRRAVVRVGLRVTLLLIAAVVVLAVAGVWWEDLSSLEAYPRVLGTIGILAALGIVVVPVLALLLKDAVHADLGGSFPPALAAALLERARDRGLSVEELVAPVLDAPGEGSDKGA